MKWSICGIALLLACGGKGGGGTDAGPDAGPDGGGLPAPAVTSITPSTGPAAGGTAVEIAGTGFQAGATLRIGGGAAPGTAVVSATRITARTPAGAAGKADVVVVNPDNQLGRLAGGFTYTSTTITAVEWCKLQFPTQASGHPGDPLSLFARVFHKGVTDKAGAGAGLLVQGSIGTAAGGFLAWADAAFNVDTDSGANDEFKLDVILPEPGNYLSAFRASLDGGPWRYCLTDGPADAIDNAKAGTVTVSPNVVGFCNLQYPTNASGFAGDPLTVYGRVYQAGVTDQPGQGGGIQMQFGIGQTDGGGFAWSDAAFNADVGNDDEYRFDTVLPAPGGYGMAFRAQPGDGGAWRYCEVDGDHADLDPGKLGTVASSALPTAVDDCKLQFPAAATAFPGDPVTLYGRVLVGGITGGAGAGRGVQMQAALDIQPDGGAAWADAGYNVEADGWDEFKLAAAAPAPGTYRTGFRASVNGGAWSHCGVGGKSAAFDPADAGTLTVRPNQVDWCRLTSQSTSDGYFADPIAMKAEVYVAGVTDVPGQGAGIAVQAGWGFADGSGWNWAPAAYSGDRSGPGNPTANDEYAFNGSLPPSAEYRTAMRASINDGGPTYCLPDGPSGTLADAGALLVRSVSLADCVVQFPRSTDGTTFAAGQPADYYGQVLVGASEPRARGVVAEVGVGPVGADPRDGGWRFLPAAYNVAIGANDEYRATLALAETQASAVAFRFSGDGRRTFLYCDQTWSNGFDAGDLSRYTTIDNPDYTLCQLLTGSAAADAGTPVTVSALVANSSGVVPVVGRQALVGPMGTDPGGPGWTAFEAGYVSGEIAAGGSVWSASVTAPAGTHGLAFRFSVDGGQWSYAAADGGCGQGFSAGGEGTLTVPP